MAKLVLVRMHSRRGLENGGRVSCQRLSSRNIRTVPPPAICAHAEFTRAIKCHCGAHRGEIHVRCNEPTVHQAKQARRHVLGPNRRGCMWITPCAALNGAFRARCFFLRPMHRSQYSSGWHTVAGTSFAVEKWASCSTLLSFPIVALWPTGRGALLNADGCIPSRWARYWRLPKPTGLFTALAWRCAAAAPGRPVGCAADRVRVAGSCKAGNCCGGVALRGSARKQFAASEGRGEAPCTTVLSMASALSFSSDSAFSTTCCRCSLCHSTSPIEKRSRMLRRSSCAWSRIRPASSADECDIVSSNGSRVFDANSGRRAREMPQDIQ